MDSSASAHAAARLSLQVVTLSTHSARHVRFRAVRSRVSRGAGRDPDRAPKPCRLTAPPPPSSARPPVSSISSALHDPPPFGLVEPERMGDRRPAHDAVGNHRRDRRQRAHERSEYPPARSPSPALPRSACPSLKSRRGGRPGRLRHGAPPRSRGRRRSRSRRASRSPWSCKAIVQLPPIRPLGEPGDDVERNEPIRILVRERDVEPAVTHSYRPGSTWSPPTGVARPRPRPAPRGSRSKTFPGRTPPRSREPRAHSRDPPPGPAAGRDRLHPLPPCASRRRASQAGA